MSVVRYLADNDLRFEILLAVRRFEPAIEFPTVRQFGLAAAPDAEILAFAARERFIVVSHDVGTMRHHAQLRVANGLIMLGLLLVPQEKLTRAVSESLHMIWAASEAEEWIGTVNFLPL